MVRYLQIHVLKRIQQPLLLFIKFLTNIFGPYMGTFSVNYNIWTRVNIMDGNDDDQ
jgi:hypothetical protein